ncbi:hypothetical protein G6F46_003519 [Rhizopus delemar]|uniref:RlpA-like protein double-psi beta-barrel domain-containing protein n=2 Tax=Rhizopus TaxID=4842 RepID=A0A9P7CPI6_9FUNG|nr:hypothetical protein G6F43_005072 [Rhizopus delemar]KAG1541782.1 hypothetical protein G6F51_007680 [Rhizopus arrhizus]KAG1449192.1 hypothetical protein G6F55_010283 [Rhizopus delemar]KAG1495890.1 hypothetical protein G6F54_006860 [Rhizopus delemar]KAG1505884.1 hypothetical protein G6F52_012045 [Rhizopus delemar]
MNKLICITTFLLVLSFCIQPSESLAIKKLAADLLSFSGKGTYYDVGPGSCGNTDTDSEMVVAINKSQMGNGANPNSNPHCNKRVKIIGSSGKACYARVVDTCPGCDHGSIDMSPALFKKVCGSLGLGFCSIKWDFV